MSEEQPPRYSITFLRHGESVGNAEARWQGQADFPLTEKGRIQARTLASRWQTEKVEFDNIISSPLERARETAEIISEVLGLSVELDAVWSERHIGEVAGMTNAEINERYPNRNIVTPYEAFLKDEGEGDWELFLRAGQALQSILRRDPGVYLVVSHGGLLNQVMHAIVGVAPQANGSGLRFRFGNTSFARVIYHPHVHRWQIDSINDHAHLKNGQ